MHKERASRGKLGGRNSRRLVGLSLLAIVYSGWLYFQDTLTGAPTWDGVIGVILGLYVCSHPAANAVDRLFFRRDARGEILSRQAGVVWLALNILTLLIGWLAIFVGATRFTAGAEM
jgi:hypothetical protein